MTAENELLLTIPYRTEFLPIVTGFVAEAGRIFGANEKESAQLRLAAEEIFSYIMEAFPTSETGVHFFLRCEEEEDAVKFTFSNHGTPINARATPEFTITDVEGTLDGLGLSLVKQVTDSFACINCGSNGWLIVIAKKLAAFQPVLCTQPVESADGEAPLLRSPLQITRATAAHIPQLIDLVYRTYRYSYAKDYFYNEDSLRKAIEDERVIALVAQDAEGHVVGNVSAFFDSPQAAEVGGIMIDPRYRAGAGLMLLVKEARRLFWGETFKNILLYAKTVTTHTATQQLMKLFKFAPLGLRLSVYSHAKFIGISEERSCRESLVFAVLTTSVGDRSLQLYIPPEHGAMIAKLFSHAAIPATCFSEAVPSADGTRTDLLRMPNEKTLLMEIEVHAFGADFQEVLGKETFAIQQNGFLTCSLFIPVDRPLPPGVDSILKENKYFFTGLQFNKENKWFLVYTNLFHQRFQFANVKLFDPLAQDLCNYIEEQYVSLYSV